MDHIYHGRYQKMLPRIKVYLISVAAVVFIEYCSVIRVCLSESSGSWKKYFLIHE